MIKQATSQIIQQAARLLQGGALVAFPTDTVFGLGADATRADAVEKIYAVKNRPRDKALPVLVSDLAVAQQLIQTDARLLSVMHAFWPGALTVIARLHDDHPLSPALLAGDKTVALRAPDHPVARDILSACGGMLAVTSANPSGQLSRVTALDVAQDLQGKIDLVLADTTPLIGMESTVLDLSGDVARIVRHGAVTAEQIEAVIGPVDVATQSGSGISLRTPLRLEAVDVKKGEAFLGFGNPQFIGVEGIGFVRDMPDGMVRNLSPEGDLHQAATNLYTMLQELDKIGATSIAVRAIPNTGLGIAINDRLRRITRDKT